MSAVYDNHVPDLVEWLSITGRLTINGEDIGDCTIRYPLNDNTESMEICESREDAVRIAQARWEHYTKFDKKEGAFARASMVCLDEDGEYDGTGEYVLWDSKEECE